MTSLGVFPANERVSMSLDDRIRQLSETIIQEARGPIEAALHHLLADVMTLAAADRDQAVQTALAEASAAHESALAALREEHERDRVDVDALRAQFERERDAAGPAPLARERAGAPTTEQLERSRRQLRAEVARRRARRPPWPSAGATRPERDAALAAARADPSATATPRSSRCGSRWRATTRPR